MAEWMAETPAGNPKPRMNADDSKDSLSAKGVIQGPLSAS
jgi:hypothetical protein